MLLCILFTRVANFKKAISFGQQVFDDFTQHPERLRNLSHVSYRAGLVDARWISFLSSLQKALGLDEQYKKAIEVQQILLNTATRVLDKTAKEAGLILSSLGFVSDVLEGEGISILEKKFNDQVLAMIAEGKYADVPSAKDALFVRHRHSSLSFPPALLPIFSCFLLVLTHA
eukprot:m.175261 g.175261  ORF g.175261 m.175261 type:complete len:172 (+) comp14608_c0_seq12:490-1005(+)